jgi:hypothetical protein
VEEGLRLSGLLQAGVHVSEDGSVHQRRGKLVCVVSNLAVEALERTLLAPEHEEPTVDEIVAVMRHTVDDRHGWRVRAMSSGRRRGRATLATPSRRSS